MDIFICEKGLFFIICIFLCVVEAPIHMYFTRNVRNRVRPLIGYSLILQVSKLKNIQCNIASFPFIYCIINTIQYPTMSCIFV